MNHVLILVEDSGNFTPTCLRFLEHIYVEAGFVWSQCVVRKVSSRIMTNNDTKSLYKAWKADYREPSDSLASDMLWMREQIAETKPSLIVMHGDIAFDTVMGQVGVPQYRGSEMVTPDGIPCIPVYSPSTVIKRWDWRMILKRDLQRGLNLFLRGYKYPEYKFFIAPTYEQVMICLGEMLLDADNSPTPIDISCDIETIAKQTACVGFGWSATEAMCIPLMSRDNAQGGFYMYEEELDIVKAMIQVLTHPNICIIGQNFSYDTQFFARFWGAFPKQVFDTMTAQHTLYPGIPKSLDFLSSMYCKFHLYWKDELKDYKNYPKDENTFWSYNCKDCVITWEAAQTLRRLLREEGLSEVGEFQQELFYPVTRMMIRGVRIDQGKKNAMALDLMDAIAERHQALEDILGFPLNPNSPKQMKKFFYEEMGQKPVKIRDKFGFKVSTNSEALAKIADREPILSPIVQLIEEIRSLKIFLSNFANAPLDADGRIRCSYNTSGTETFRFSSSKSVFGTGANLQTISKGTEK